MAKENRFHITKWYLDCVTASGDAAIFYAAHVSWRALRLNYSSLLLCLSGRVSTHSSSRAPFPHARDEDTLAVDAPQFHLNGEWHRVDTAIGDTLFDGPDGAVHWQCMQPKAAVDLRVGEHSLKGLGYAECLTMTIPPWRLPLHRLQWGRWLSPASSVIWIDWSGPHAARRTWINGSTCPSELISPSEVRLEDSIELRLDRGVTLREGRLGETVLRAAPFLSRVFPPAMFGIRETKWLSSATLARGSEHESGWAIHEMVEWNK